ncbi:MAG: antibiotic biosynthesis monooxygenase family protein [Bacillota bacterium]|nr:antibiotic biosynthesis monooxygenase family protein [Bacillota bacterium]
MIARTWHGIVPAGKAGAFEKHLIATGVNDTKSIPGNLGSYIYHQTQDGFEHFFMISYWKDFEAIKAFAGPKPQIAVTYPGDSEFELISDPIVLHHEVSRITADFPI